MSSTALLFLSSLFWTAPRLACPMVEPKTIRVDGIINEWGEVTPLTLSASDIVSGADKRNNDKDLSVDIRCVYAEGEGVYLLVEVTDSRIIVGGKNSENDDHVVISLGDPSQKLTIIPPDERRKAMASGLPKNGMARAVRQELGYAIEMGIPWGTWNLSPDLIEVPVSVTIYDTDSSVAGKPETVIALDKLDYPRTSHFEFAAIRALQDQIFDKLGIGEADIKFSKIGNYAAGKKLERAIWAGKYIILLGGDAGISFFYIQLAEESEHVLKCQDLDVDGDGVMDFFTEIKVKDHPNEWKMVAVWSHRPRGIERIFAHMLEFSAGDHFLVNAYKLSEKNKKAVLEFSFVKASPSITQKNWKGSPPDPDIQPFIMPWDKPAKRTFTFSYGKSMQTK